MTELIITGGVPLQGTMQVSGAKNAALPMMAAAILLDEPLELLGVPRLTDVPYRWGGCCGNWASMSLTRATACC